MKEEGRGKREGKEKVGICLEKQASKQASILLTDPNKRQDVENCMAAMINVPTDLSGSQPRTS